MTQASPGRQWRVLLPLLAFMLLVPAQADAASKHESAVVAQLSKVRQASGLSALRSSPALVRQSRSYARKMLRENRWAHARRGNTAEILAVWPGKDGAASQIVSMWMHSAVHKRAIMNRRYRRVGVASVTGRFRGKVSTIFVARLAR